MSAASIVDMTESPGVVRHYPRGVILDRGRDDAGSARFQVVISVVDQGIPHHGAGGGLNRNQWIARRAQVGDVMIAVIIGDVDISVLGADGRRQRVAMGHGDAQGSDRCRYTSECRVLVSETKAHGRRRSGNSGTQYSPVMKDCGEWLIYGTATYRWGRVRHRIDSRCISGGRN